MLWQVFLVMLWSVLGLVLALVNLEPGLARGLDLLVAVLCSMMKDQAPEHHNNLLGLEAPHQHNLLRTMLAWRRPLLLVPVQH